VFAREEWLPKTASPRKRKSAGLRIIINKKRERVPGYRFFKYFTDH
jgi:hypothetical protein